MSSASSGGYRAVTGHWDETADATGRLRPHWSRLMASLEALGDDELSLRATLSLADARYWLDPSDGVEELYADALRRAEAIALVSTVRGWRDARLT